MSPELVLAVVALFGLTIPIAIGGAFIGRSTYLKSLPARIAQLEDQDIRNQAALKRQAQELELWKGVATQTPELRELVRLFKEHHEGATGRFIHIEAQHDAIMEDLHAIKVFMESDKK